MYRNEHQPDSHIKRVVLPSGKTIEVVYFADGGQPRRVRDAESEELHICRECEGALVYPTDWEEAGSEHWHVSLRCPNCEYRSEGIYSQEMVDIFDEELDRGTELLVTDLKRMMRANMAEEIDRFVYALAVDAVLPSDF